MDDDAVRVAIVGGHPVIRGLVRLACDAVPGAQVVVEASGLAEALEAVSGSDADLLVVDLDLADGDGIEVLRQLGARDAPDGERPRILVLSDREDGQTVLESLRLGATGYLGKAEGLRGLTAAVRAVADGRRVVPARLDADAQAELHRYARRSRERAAVERDLTIREREVLTLLAADVTLQQIARRLSISPRTVESHASSIYRKLGVRGRLQAVSRAAAIGLVDLTDAP
jgi:DNA-binding NarL/FixJ family response regulator